MTDDKPTIVHVAHKDPALPEETPDKCPNCGSEPEMGFGMAGGGMGVYSYCPKCGILLSKTETHD